MEIPELHACYWVKTFLGKRLLSARNLIDEMVNEYLEDQRRKYDDDSIKFHS